MIVFNVYVLVLAMLYWKYSRKKLLLLHSSEPVILLFDIAFCDESETFLFHPQLK